MDDGYTIERGRERIRLDDVNRMLKNTYWACNRSEERTLKAIDNTIPFGVYDADGNQVGFARVMTDYATCYYVCDVVIDEAHRGRGLGKALMAAITSDPELDPLSGYLVTQDAFGLYEKYGFVRVDNFMRRPKKF